MIDYEEFCGLGFKEDASNIASLELKKLLDTNAPLYLIDVRQPIEYSQGHLNAKNIPLDELQSELSKLPNDKQIVFYCKSGARSAKALKLAKSAGFKQAQDLSGGILKYRESFDLDIKIL